MRNRQEDSIKFIKEELIAEMVHDRCFCEAGSREFVELESVCVEPLQKLEISTVCEFYQVDAIIRFSGEEKNFSLIVKLLPVVPQHENAYELFQNEELFYSKISMKYDIEISPRCYLSDMGRYGRPAIVLENLEARGYQRVYGKLDNDLLELCLKRIGKFHARGLRLKTEKFNLFREFFAKFLETLFTDQNSLIFSRKHSRVLEYLKSLPESDPARKHGNLLFKYENGKPIDLKIIDWQTMRYSSASIDLGPILFRNLSVENASESIPKFLKIYLDAVTMEYPGGPLERLQTEFLSKLLYTYVILSLDESIPVETLMETLRQSVRV
ncbi:uncharacterized protein LOC107272182 isoform X2 [Cephus cinctus]|uniref:Uncharacterized protein LOC107272182 isoform X2 n=1 Tax=Cephus cinctus TaxID=211228 RepID=A0AAJ7W5E9_CEPCN|nr:uncharacterized protein LOC107272182 isoform X2 [Cephus cinctus]